MTLSERLVGNWRVKMSGRGKNATDAVEVGTRHSRQLQKGMAKLGVSGGYLGIKRTFLDVPKVSRCTVYDDYDRGWSPRRFRRVR